jgi:hypothetical protein
MLPVKLRTIILFVIMFVLIYTIITFTLYKMRTAKTDENSQLMQSSSSRVITPTRSTVFYVDKNSSNLSIAILTIARPNDHEYLFRTISSLHDEISTQDGIIDRVLVFHPRDSQKHKHNILDMTKKEFESNQFIFKEKDCLDEADYGGIKNHHGIWRKVTPKDVQQNNDFIGMLEQVKNFFCSNEKALFMIMEDDFEYCKHSMNHMRRVIYAAYQYYPNWTGIRVSYGLNGIILRCQHVNGIQEYLRKNRFRGPADSLLGIFWTVNSDEAREVFTAPDSVFLTYQHNLLHHIGETSSIISGDEMKNRIYPGCYDILQTGAVMERFDPVNCYNKEFTPCSNPNVGPSILNVMRGNSLFDSDFQMKKKTSNIEIITSKSGEDCISACERNKRTCARYMLPLINSCDVLNMYFSCAWCVEHEYFLPREAHRNPLFLETTGSCWYGAIASELKCEGSHPKTIRLCPCAS